MQRRIETANDGASRREFLKTSALAAVAGGGLAGTLAAPKAAHADAGDTLRVALIGCGGRGTGAAVQAMKADKNVKLVAMADAFEDRLQSSLSSLQKSEVAAKVDVPPERQFAGFDAYRQALDVGIDVALLASPPHFRPLHLQACVDKGIHVFAEKPVAVDAPGVRWVLKTCEEARRKNLSVVSGLCLRYSRGFHETIARIHDGRIGDVVTLVANDYRGPIWIRPRQSDWTDMHWQMRNWYYFTWLSGDFNVEQHVHFLDVCAWVMKDQYPAKAIGLGGRQVRTGPEYGNIYDHHAVVYEYENGARLVSNCRQIPGCKNDISGHVLGTQGRSLITERRNGLWTEPYGGGERWVWRGEEDNFYQYEHDVLFASVRNGKPVNNGEYMAKSTLLAIMGRMATYTGQEVSWEQAMNSTEDLTPARYEWGEIAAPAVPMPGVTKLL
jgi:predicted dehydrogenase